VTVAAHLLIFRLKMGETKKKSEKKQKKEDYRKKLWELTE
jgi:hypothetical protein